MEEARRWWIGRSRREQVLLMVLALAVGLAAVWYGVVAPLYGWQAAAADRHAQAAADHALVSAALGERDGPSPGPADLERQVRAAAEAQALVIDAVQPGEEGGVEVTVDSAGSTQLFAWIGALEREQGLIVHDFTVLENADATLQAQVGFSGRRR